MLASEADLNPLTKPKSKHSMLPMLTTLFILSYALMVLLIVEQGHTIQSQRVVLQQLLVDSTELSHMKGQAHQKETSRGEIRTWNRPKSNFETPSSQAPTQEQPKFKAKSVPARPTMPATDKADLRRSVRLI